MKQTCFHMNPILTVAERATAWVGYDSQPVAMSRRDQGCFSMEL